MEGGASLGISFLSAILHPKVTPKILHYFSQSPCMPTWAPDPTKGLAQHNISLQELNSCIGSLNMLGSALVHHLADLCRGRPYWTLARPQSTCSGWDGRSSQRQSTNSASSFALPPAGFLQTNVRVHHTVTQDSPSRGAVTGHSQLTVHMSRRRQQNTGVQELLQ